MPLYITINENVVNAVGHRRGPYMTDDSSATSIKNMVSCHFALHRRRRLDNAE